jgi:hypothetical protein
LLAAMRSPAVGAWNLLARGLMPWLKRAPDELAGADGLLGPELG